MVKLFEIFGYKKVKTTVNINTMITDLMSLHSKVNVVRLKSLK
jgi:hypothetical protein